jgi:hypothetical protein
MSEVLMKALIYRQIGSWRQVVPETVDAVRALAGGVKDGAISIALADRALGSDATSWCECRSRTCQVD